MLVINRIIYILLSLLVVAVGLLNLVGCRDQPLGSVQPLPPPAIVTGPYLTEPEGNSLVLRFETNRSVTAALRYEGSNKTLRFATSDNWHFIRLTDLPQTPTNVTIYLDERKVTTLNLKAPPQRNETTRIAFISGLGQRSDLLLQTGNLLATLQPDVVFVGTDCMPSTREIAAWREKFFRPLAKSVSSVPWIPLPGTVRTQPSMLYAAIDKDVPMRSWTWGSIDIIAMELDAVVSAGNAGAELRRRLQERLSVSGNRWRLVFLDKPLFAAQTVDALGVEALTPTLENDAVSVVIAGGENGYQRTQPIGENMRGAVRYFVVGGEADVKPERDFILTSQTQPVICMVEADNDFLTVDAVNLYGQVIDSLQLRMPPRQRYPEVVKLAGREPLPEELVSRNMLLQQALTLRLLQRELLSIARQSVKAVKNPLQPQKLEILIRNPTTWPFNGQLSWSLPVANSDFLPEPQRMAFQLESGQAALASFNVSPPLSQSLAPMLTVEAAGVGYARQQLFLTPTVSVVIPKLELKPEQIHIDGQAAEGFWQRSALLDSSQFRSASGLKSVREMRARVAYTDTGLLVSIVCEGGRGGQKANRHDDDFVDEESVEIALDPEAMGRDYLQYAVTAHGIRQDRSSAMGNFWNPDWECKTRGYQLRGRSWWETEAFIPFTAMNIDTKPEVGQRLGFNIYRYDHNPAPVPADADPRLAMRARFAADDGQLRPLYEIVEWAYTEGIRYRSGAYGNLIFGEVAAAPVSAEKTGDTDSSGSAVEDIWINLPPPGSAEDIIPPTGVETQVDTPQPRRRRR